MSSDTFILTSGDDSGDCGDALGYGGEYFYECGGAVRCDMSARIGSGGELIDTLSLNVYHSTHHMRLCRKGTLLYKLSPDISRKGYNHSGNHKILLAQSPLKFSSSFILTLDIIEALFCVGKIVDLCDLFP